MKYAFIEHHQATFTVALMCNMMDVSRTTFYDWLKRPESARSFEDRRLR
ncbi:MAG: helix-turn-helix domain-containing protein [Gammaproteobacteria bacterium]|nr:helix-turn-helix domain-containing protein [Gammaproteobacteria bacterium]